jgi:hypothetical protein
MLGAAIEETEVAIRLKDCSAANQRNDRANEPVSPVERRNGDSRGEMDFMM